MEHTLDEIERAYMESSGGDARDTLRRALADAMEKIVTVSKDAGHRFIRAARPADLARKLGRERQRSRPRPWPASDRPRP